ncbi:MAG: hypothetical protein P8O98_02065 [Flavobacteriaceae bacterium]|nr:hypothetical protein [Flavobacteriaceae bacterium]MBT6127373.1 hypothetical protein [Flavobacteriaceae bacterium]MDG1027773.1 hypothetical protein [Flavobacteriaceae bacterium]MDG1941448.1 hypothetical protein [Flavobacteriaceae bacterium]
MRNKELFQGVIASFFASSSAMIFILLYFSEGPIEDAIVSLFQQKKLGGLISIGALINLPLFFLGMHKRKTNFAKGVMITSIIIVMMVAILKII